jgi:hypothetical protein
VKSVTASAVAVVSVLGVLGLDPRASAEPSATPLAFQGSIAGATDLQPQDLSILLEPDPSWLDAHPESDSDGSIHESTVPASAVTTNGGDYAIRLDPATVPPEDITADGLVTLTISAENKAGDAYGTDVLSIRAVLLPDGSYAWVDPLTPSELVDTTGTPPAALRTYRVAARSHGRFRPTRMWVRRPQAPVVDDITRFPGRGNLGRAIAAARVPARRAATVADDEPSGGTVDQTQPIDDPVYDSSKCVPGPGGNGAGVVRGATRKVMTTIGTSFPVGKDEAKMVFDDSNSSSARFTAEMGTAFQDGTGPILQASKLKAMDKTWGFDWAMSGDNRAYQVQEVYQHVTDWGDRCPGDPNGPYFQTWEATKYTGGQTELTDIGTPDYTHCVPEGSVGVWKKLNTSSDAYDNNTGVRIADWIGINLESVRAYNLEAQLWYKMATTTHYLCGNNTDPAHSQKVQDFLYDNSSKR